MVDTLVKGLQKFSAQEWEKIHASRTDEIPQHELIAYSKVKRRLYVKYMFMRQSNARSWREIRTGLLYSIIYTGSYFHIRLGYLNQNSGDKAEMEKFVIGGTRTVQLW